MSYEKDIDHESTDEIVCPFCGYEFSDSWDIGSDEENLGLIECYECGKSFYTSREVSVSYSTQKANYGICKHCKRGNVVIEDHHSSIGEYSDLCVECGILEKQKLLNDYIWSLGRTDKC